MKRIVSVLVLVCLLLLVSVVPTSAGNPGQQFIEYQIGTSSNPAQYTLVLNNSSTVIGKIMIKVEGENLIVSCDTESPWVMINSHLAVASGGTRAEAEGKITDIPGKFDKLPWPTGYYGASKTYPVPYVTTTSYTVPLSYFPDMTNNYLVICFHTSVQHSDSTNQNSAWAVGVGGPVPPVPETPVIVLLGAGIAGLATLIIIRHKKSLAKV